MTWKNSLKAFINKKRNNQKSFYDIYINEFYNNNFHKLVKLDLKKINDLILDEIIHDKNTILKFIGNCEIKNRKDVRNIHRMIFIFKKEGKMYIDYQTKIYQLKRIKTNFKLDLIKEKEEDFDSIGIELEESLSKTILKNYKKYTIIQLTDLINDKKKYNNKCFCYLVITEKILSQFYKWNC